MAKRECQLAGQRKKRQPSTLTAVAPEPTHGRGLKLQTPKTYHTRPLGEADKIVKAYQD